MKRARTLRAYRVKSDEGTPQVVNGETFVSCTMNGHDAAGAGTLASCGRTIAGQIRRIRQLILNEPPSSVKSKRVVLQEERLACLVVRRRSEIKKHDR